MQNISRRIFTAAVASGLIVAAFVGGVYAGYENRPEVEKVTELFNKQESAAAVAVDFAPFWRAWNALNEKHVDAENLDAQEKVWGAISGLAASTDDPYTVFFPPEESKVFEEDISGSFGGVGMEIGIRDNILTVISPLKDTPAERAGIESGDKIISIDGESTSGITVEEAVQKIRGEIGTEVELVLSREGVDDSITVTVTRANIQIPTIETEIKDQTFIIRLFNFSSQSPFAFRNALREFAQSNTNQLILDLRGNPGGFLEAAVDMASWFLPSGKAIVKEELRHGEEGRVYRSKGYDIFNENLEMVVLVNGGSASASEILAGALSEHGVATVIGTTTFGKGSVQELVRITDETSLKVTVAKWLTPEGVSISEGGITPDIEAPIEDDDVEEGTDPQLERALEFLNQN